MKAIVMAGGYGKRLRPLTCCMPKPMVPVLNKPIIDYGIDLLKLHDFCDVTVTLQYLPEQIQQHLGNGRENSVRISYSVEDAPLGTAGSVLKANANEQGQILVMSGDALTDVNLRAALAFHNERRAKATIILKRVPMPTEYGIVLCEKDGRIEKFWEKPSRSQLFSDLANTGIYILEPEVLELIPQNRAFDFSADLFPLMMKYEMPIFGFETNGYWCDVGNLHSFLQAQWDVLDGKCRCGTNAATVVRGNIFLEAGASVSEKAQILGPAYISQGVQIAPDALIGPYAVLGTGTRVGSNASIKRSVLMRNARVYDRAELRGTVICPNAVLENRACAFENSVLGEKSVLGERATLKNGVLVWPEKHLKADGEFVCNVVWDEGTEKRVQCVDNTFRFRVDNDSALRNAAFLGAAVASELTADREIAIATDGTPSSVMFKYALVSGCMSQGANVLDVGAEPLPVFCYALRSLGVQAGVRIWRNPTEAHTVMIEIRDRNGLPIHAAQVRKITELFSRQEFFPNTSHPIGLIQTYFTQQRGYIAGLLRKVDVERMRAQGIRMRLKAPQLIMNVLYPVLRHCGVTVVSFGQREYQGLGCEIDDSGKIVLVSADHRTFFPQESFALSSYLAAKGEMDKVLLPAAYSTAYAKLFQEEGIQVVPVSGNAAELERVIYDKMPRLYQECMDPILRCLRFAEHAQDGDFWKFAKNMPVIEITREELPLPENDMAMTMRNMVEMENTVFPEFSDGIKWSRKEGWVLVRPAAQRNAIQVFAASTNAEYSRELADLFVNRIKGVHKEP